MKLFVVGATGGIGRLILKFGLEKGHELTAFARSPEKIQFKDRHLNMIAGDLYDVNAMSAAMKNHDAVLSAFGPTTLKTTDLRQKFGKAISQAAEQAEVKRVLLVSSALLFENIGIVGGVLKSTLFKQMLPDMANMEKELMKSSVEWTVVRPPRLSDGALTQEYLAERNNLPNHAGRVVSRADVADFMLKEAVENAFSRAIVGVC